MLHSQMQSRRRKRQWKGPRSVNGKTLLVQCNRPDLGTNYAQLVLQGTGLQIDYVIIRAGMVVILHTERLQFRQHKEARLLHDGNGWNVSELYCWVRSLEAWEDDDE